MIKGKGRGRERGRGRGRKRGRERETDLNRRVGEGGSVPKARAPMVSIMRFTQSIITAFNGGS